MLAFFLSNSDFIVSLGGLHRFDHLLYWILGRGPVCISATLEFSSHVKLHLVRNVGCSLHSTLHSCLSCNGLLSDGQNSYHTVCCERSSPFAAALMPMISLEFLCWWIVYLHYEIVDHKCVCRPPEGPQFEIMYCSVRCLYVDKLWPRIYFIYWY